jgi:DNA polymerase-1
LTDKDGHNVNVVYGFFRMLFKVFQEKPDYLVITWDSPVKTLRHEVYAEYKANRKKMEDDFKHQIPLTKAIVQEV